MSEPVEYQYRTRPDWIPEWNGWNTCSKESAEAYEKTPYLHDWHYEVRRLYTSPPAQQDKTDWEAVAADQAMTIALLKAELQEFANKEADAVEVALTESGWVWDGDQWQRPPQTWIELDHDDIHALMNEFFYRGMQPSGPHFSNFARAIEAKLKEKNA